MSIIDQIKSHVSIRKYKPDPVPQEIITEILEAGIRASSSGNMNTCSIIVTTDPEIRQQLHEPHMKQSMVLDAPVFLTFCADFNRMRKWLKQSDAPDGFDNFMSFMVAAFDAVLISQNVALAAESHGLGICYLGSTFANADQISKVLNIPKGVMPVVGFSLGWPDEAPALRDRLPLDGIVHQETYQDYSEADITRIFKDREKAGWERYMSVPRLKKLVEENDVENLAQIYTVVKYSRESHQEFSNKVLAFLKDQDFMNHELWQFI
mgnify:CR=1 FL=1